MRTADLFNLPKSGISIIIPIYNAERYLTKCLSSLVCQTFKNIEIICVNDKSTDNSLKILEKYARKYPQIKIINITKSGAGFARNTGLKYAKYDYVGFIDADDYVDFDYFEKMYNSAKKYDADIVTSSIIREKTFYKKFHINYTKEKIAYTIPEKINMCKDKKEFFFYAWNKLYKKSLLLKNNIKFTEGRCYEDVMFSVKALFYSNKIVSVPKVLYHYVAHKNSTVKSKPTKKTIADKTAVFKELQLFANSKNIILPERTNYHTIQERKIFNLPIVKEYIGEFYRKKVFLGIIPFQKYRVFNEPIDIIYLWVNDGDKEWQKKKRKYEQEGINEQSNAMGRYRDNNELKYSLRSLEKNAPWINKIYIVTDNQHPKWLDINHPKITIVPHSKLIPKKYLPTYNSNLIEMYIENIPGLTEYFLYSNDDMIFNKPVTPAFFFTRDRKPIIRFKQQVSRRNLKTSLYSRLIIRMQYLVKKKFRKNYPYAPHHATDAYTKSIMRECKKEFSKEYEITNKNRFRSESDIQRVIVSYYALATGKGEMRRVTRYSKDLTLIEKVKLYMSGRYSSESRCFAINDKEFEKHIAKYNPTLVCINDDEHASEEDRERLKQYFARRFPIKSCFEK